MNTEQELRPAACPFCAAALVENGELVRFWKHPVRSLEEAKCPGSHVSIEFHPEPDNEALARWNRRSSDEQAEVVGLTADEQRIMHQSLLSSVKVVASPAVAKGGVTDAVLDKAFADFVRGRDAAIDARPEVVDLNQVVRAGLREALTAALAVGDEGSWQIKLIAEPDSGEAVNTYHATSPSGKVLTVFAANEAEAISFARRHRSPPSRGEGE